MSFNTKSSLLYSQDLQHSEDDYGFPPSNKPSYYKRGNLLGRSSTTSSFRQKYKGFRARSSSYNSLDDDKNQNDNLLHSQDIPAPSVVVSTTPTAAPNTSLFSRKNLGMTAERSSTAPPSYFASYKQDLDDNSYDSNEDDSDESTLFAKQGSYSRQNFNRTSSWKSCVLRAVGVKRSTR